VHQPLIEVARAPWRQQAASQLPQATLDGCPAGIALHSEQTTEHAADIAIHRRLVLAESDTEHGPGSVLADAGQGHEWLTVGGELAAVSLHHQAGSGVKVTGSGVVAQPLPHFEHLVEVGCGQILKGWETGEEAAVVGEHGGHLRLLQHDHRHPEGVGIVGVSPGEVGQPLLRPSQQTLSDGTAPLRGCQGIRRLGHTAIGEESEGLPGQRANHWLTFYHILVT